MATHSSILVWRIPWTEEPGMLQSMRSQRVRHGWATNTFTAAAEGSESKDQILLLAAWSWENWFVTWGESQGRSRGEKGCLRWFAPHPSFDYVECRGREQLIRSGSWAFWSFLYLVHNCLQPHIHTAFFKPHIVSLYFVARGDICPGATTAAKDPRSWGPACLKTTWDIQLHPHFQCPYSIPFPGLLKPCYSKCGQQIGSISLIC